MKRSKTLQTMALVAGLAVAAWAAPAGATTLRRAGLDELVATNRTIVVGEVVDAASYWNPERTMILTDVYVAPTDVLKGDDGGALVVTLQGGTVGDTTVVIVGGAELLPGRSYVLFVDRDDLPGVGEVATVRDHSQGVFELLDEAGGQRAVSEASRHPLVPDAAGESRPPGGGEGLPLADLVRSIRQQVERGETRGEVR